MLLVQVFITKVDLFFVFLFLLVLLLFLFLFLLHVFHVLVPELVVKLIVYLVKFVIFFILFFVFRFFFRFTVHISVEVIFHLEIIVFLFFVALVVFIRFLFVFLFFLTLVILKAFKLLLVLDLIGDVLFATFAVAKTAAILLAVFFEVTRGLHIRVVFVFLTAVALVDEMDEDTLTQETELHHVFQEHFDSAHRFP
jgi:hypothetical protein